MVNKELRKRFCTWCIIGGVVGIMAAGARGGPPAGYRYVWGDEFNGSTLDTAKWRYREGPSLYSWQLLENVALENGALRIDLKQQSYGDCSYTGGGVISTTSYKYGYFETRARMSGVYGWHESFWATYTYGAVTGPGETRIEIDGFEQPGDWSMNRYNYGVMEWPADDNGYSISLYDALAAEDLSRDYHIYGFEVTPDYVRFSRDGTILATTDMSGVDPWVAFNLWLSCIASKSNAAPAGAVYFDYCRAYTKDPKVAAVTIDTFDQGFTGWATASNWVIQPQANVTDPKIEGLGSMALLTDRIGTGYIRKSWNPKLDLSGKNAIEFSVYLSTDTNLGGGGLDCNLVDGYGRVIYFRVGAGEITAADRGRWVTVHLAMEKRYSSIDGTNLPYASLAGSTFNNRSLSETKGSYASNYLDRGFYLNITETIELGIGSTDGSNKYWYVDDLKAVAGPVCPGVSRPQISDPLVYYSFDDSAFPWVDWSGHGYTGTPVRGWVSPYTANTDPATVVTGSPYGRFGRGTIFPAVRGGNRIGLAIPVSSILKSQLPTTDLTISVWVNMANPAKPAAIFSAAGGVNSAVELCSAGWDPGRGGWRFVLNYVSDTTGTVTRIVELTTNELAPVANEWIHVAFEYSFDPATSAGQVAIWVNGNQAASAVIPADGPLPDRWNGTATFGVAANDWSGQFEGLLDEAYIFNRALGSVEVRILADRAVLPGDANGDNKVDVSDLGILAANYGRTTGTWPMGDFNKDGCINISDLGILAANYGEGTGNPSEAVFYSDDLYLQKDAIMKGVMVPDENGRNICPLFSLPLLAGLMLFTREIYE